MTNMVLGLMRVGDFLFAPSALLTDVAERRRARLLAKLELVHVVQLIVGIFMVLFVGMPGAPTHMTPILGVAVALIGVAYALSRTRHLRLSIWTYIVVASAISPAMALLTTGVVTNPTVAILAIIYLLPPVLLASVMSSARQTFLSAIVGVVVSMVAIQASGKFSTLGDSLQQGCFFFVTCTVLVVIFSVHRDNVQADRAAELRARNVELEALRRTLEDRVIERTSALSQRNADMRLVLDHVAQGIFTIDAAGRMSSEHSAVLHTWFGVPTAGEVFFDYLGRVAPAFGEMTEMTWQQVQDGTLPMEVCLAQLPTALSAQGRCFRLSYDAIDRDRVGRFLVVISDVTTVMEQERSEREKKETLAVLEHLLSDRQAFLQFVHDTSSIMTTLERTDLVGVELKRALHTVKGNAMLMGIQSVGAMCQEAENCLAAGGQLAAADLHAIPKRWRRLSSDVEIILGARKENIEIAPARYHALMRAIRVNPSRETLVRMAEEMTWEPVEPRLRLFADHAERLAERFERRIEAVVESHEVYIDHRPWAPLWVSLVHAVRNAVDHGIEPPAERAAAGKPEAGRIVFRAYQQEGTTILEVQDDGRGIDWDAVRERCRALGLPFATGDDLTAGLFADGVSTAARVTDVSGRGIGMPALQAAVVALGGEMHVLTEPGRGTCIRMQFAPVPHDDLTTPRSMAA